MKNFDGLKPEPQARLFIDEKLMLAGWKVQTWLAANLGEGLGVAIRKCPTDSGLAEHGGLQKVWSLFAVSNAISRGQNNELDSLLAEMNQELIA
ncbi:hypothetical protein [Vibrio alginolyticus]|uniref:hypothetical protein n=1 Tax=Vibrio alginolyticus TaxID=663 RepID=UPI0037550A3C